jgi:RimJ/RimL family protein N-acetyltransferase
MLNVLPVTLQGRYVRLEPLSLDHVDDLATVALDDEIWRWSLADVRTTEDLRDYVRAALREREAGAAVPFATVALAAGRAVGSTRYANISVRDGRLEIGWTWIARPWQRTAVNTEAKYLMLRHAFDHLGCTRVEFKTDALNARSRAALLRIGAVEEGTMRRHMLTRGGRIRDSVYFRIVDSDWPTVRERLETRLAAGQATSA